MTKRRIAQISIIATGATLIFFGIVGAVQVPTGFNIAAALIITLGLLVEAPLTMMAVAKHEPKHAPAEARPTNKAA